ncbi:MAG: aldo/keto reductase [Spartobacteria bacterium]|nr:aldo/keto reductase [Spartobacteria bacterium]
MKYRAYGKTGKKISAIAAGTMRFTDSSKIEENADMLLYAHERGINYFDTAPLYCDDKSEETTGRALRQMKAGSYYVSTKSSQSDGAALRRDLERSLERLGVDRIHFFHIWCLLSLPAWEERKSKGAVEAALKARDEGLIEHLVFSTHLPGDEMIDVISEDIFEGVTVGYSAMNFMYREKGIQAAAAKEMGVVTMNPLGGGLIPQHAERFDFLRTPDDPDVVTAALRFICSNPHVTAALVGFSSREHVDQAVRALDDFTPYPSAHIEHIRAQVMDNFDGLCTGCGYCLPCPQGIEIPKWMDAWNMQILSGQEKDLRERLQWHWWMPPEAAGACVACGLCEERCTQHLPIMERLEKIAAMKG